MIVRCPHVELNDQIQSPKFDILSCSPLNIRFGKVGLMLKKSHIYYSIDLLGDGRITHVTFLV
jgi:phosphatidate phosphatase PAH1